MKIVIFIRIETQDKWNTLTLYLLPPPLFEVRERTGIAAHPLGKDSFELLDVFNKTTLANESLITFVMLHNPDTKCE